MSQPQYTQSVGVSASTMQADGAKNLRENGPPKKRSCNEVEDHHDNRHSTNDPDVNGADQLGGDSSSALPLDPTVNKMLTCFYRTKEWEGVERCFIFIKRNGKVVNFDVGRIPWLIQRLNYYYSCKGKDLESLMEALQNCEKTIKEAQAELDVDELDL